MSILTCNNISLEYGTKEIIKNISFSVNESAKLGVIGVNGAGKSTLLKIITGQIEATSGDIFISKDKKIGYINQQLEQTLVNTTVFEYALSPFSHLIKMENTMRELESHLGDNINNAEKYAALQHNYYLNGGNEYLFKVKSYLSLFSFSPEMYDFPAEKLSGGQKTRLALLTLLLSEVDIFLLDEPTNHLDIKAVEWFESFIKSSNKTFIVISHDRYFLDKIATDILEIENLTSTVFTGNYSQFIEKKQQAIEIQTKHYELQQKEIKRIESIIENQRRWGQERNFITIKSKQKQIDRIERIDKPKAPPKTISINLTAGSKSHQILSVRNLSKSFGENNLFSDLSFDMYNKEKLFLIGSNGCGKSTFLKIINNKLPPDSGVFEIGYSQIVGYYDQEIQILDPNNMVIDELFLMKPNMLPSEARKILAGYGFYGEDVFKKVEVLSGGEKARLSIMKLVQNNAGFLILDEPTNHLDIASKEILENALIDFDGAILCVSHDRYFINKLATRIIELDKTKYETGYIDYKGKYSNFKAETELIAAKSDIVIKSDKTGKDDFNNRKKEKSKLKSASKRIVILENTIPEKEKELKDLEKELNLNAHDYKKVESLYTQLELVKTEIEVLYDEYFSLQEELGKTE
ncbi:ABC-F family ATP-binding cassette domain-containing protein [Eubacteriales bacterium OttesenSCG-928-G02]|nr:ABC-F family ATP-binding cassette domain-containing protein [Eubacteriales bacterium OttesenSCG-928-G02]